MSARPHFLVKGENMAGYIDQSRYGDCGTCAQRAGGDCFDLRFGRSRQRHRSRPHPGRHIVVQDKRGRPTIGGAIPGQELGTELLERVEQWAAEHGDNRANAVRILLGRALDAEDRRRRRR